MFHIDSVKPREKSGCEGLNTVLRFVLLLFAALLTGQGAFANTYYIAANRSDSNAGTIKPLRGCMRQACQIARELAQLRHRNRAIASSSVAANLARLQ